MTVSWNYNNMPLLLAELVSQGLADPDPLSELVSQKPGESDLLPESRSVLPLSGNHPGLGVLHGVKVRRPRCGFRLSGFWRLFRFRGRFR